MIRMAILLLFLCGFTANAAEPLPFKGELRVKDSGLRAAFELKSEKDGQVISIKPVDTENSCDFKLSRIEPPHPERGRGGLIFSTRGSDCRFKMKEEKAGGFWNSVALVDFDFHVQEDGRLTGNARLSSVKNISSATLRFERESF